MAPSASERPLGSFETALTLSGEHAPFAVVVAVRLEGVPREGVPRDGMLTPERLRAALDAAQGEMPLLRVRIEGDRRGFRFVVDPASPPIPLTVRHREGEEDWQRVVEAELNRGLTVADAPLLRCTLLRGDGAGDGCELILALHHAIVDAVSCDRLVKRLLEPATDPQPLSSLPPAADDLFPQVHRGPRGALRRAAFLARQLADEAAFRWRRRTLPQPPVPAAGRCRVLPLRLDAAATAALVRRARRRRVTLNAALNAALLLAAGRHLPHLARGPQRYVTFADLRPYLQPPPPDGGLGCYISMLRYTADLAPDPSLWPLAQRMTAQVGAGAHRGDKYAAARLAPLAMRQTLARGDQRMGATAVSYSGPARVGPAGEGAPAVTANAVTALHAFISNFPTGPEYTVAARLFAGALHLDVLYLDCDMDAARARDVADTFLALLREEGRDGQEGRDG